MVSKKQENTMKKTLLRCPKCEAFGEIRTLALILEDGSISIQRQMAKGRRDYTVISGRDFTIYCGHCGNPAFVRKEASGTNSNIGQPWFYWQQVSGTLQFGTS